MRTSGGQRGCRILESRNDVPRCGAVVEEAALAVPDQRALAGVAAVAQLEQRDLALRLPDEEIEVLVVEPAALGGRVVRDPVDFFQHVNDWTTLASRVLSSNHDRHVNLFSPQPLDGLLATHILRRKKKGGKRCRWNTTGRSAARCPRSVRGHDCREDSGTIPLYDISFVFIDPMDRSLLAVER